MHTPLRVCVPRTVSISRPLRVSRAVLALGCGFLSLLSAAEPASLEERVRALETQLGTLARENATLKKQLGLDAPAPAAHVTAAGRESKLSIGGYVQAHAEFGDAPDARFAAGDRFLVRRARTTLKGTFADGFGFTLQSDLGSNSAGSVTAARAQATDLFVTWNRHEAANVTVGQFKTPYGYEQLLPDTKVIAIERALPSDQLTLSRQLGAMVSGSVSEKRLGYALGVFNGNGINTSANDNDAFLYVGRATALVLKTETQKLAFGAGAFTSRDNGTFAGRRTGTAVDVQWTAGRLEIDGEFFRTHFDRATGTDSDARGWSLLGAYYVVPKKLMAVARREVYDPNRTLNGDDTRLWTFGLNYRISGDDLMLSLNYIVGNPPGAREREERLISRMQVIF